MSAFVAVDVNCFGNGALAEKLAEVSGVQEVHQVAGQDGYLLKLRVADTETLGRILREELAMIEGIGKTRTQIVLSTFKETRRMALSTPDPE